MKVTDKIKDFAAEVVVRTKSDLAGVVFFLIAMIGLFVFEYLLILGILALYTAIFGVRIDNITGLSLFLLFMTPVFRMILKNH